MRLVVVLDVALVLLALGARGGRRPLGGRLVALDVPRRPARRARRARGAGRSGRSRPRCRSSPGCSGSSSTAYRNGVRRRTLLVAPAARPLGEPPRLGRARRGARRCCSGASRRSSVDRGAEPLYPVALLVLAPLCVLATPYGWDLVAYYDLMLVDAPFADILREWQWSSPSGTTALFWVLAAVAVGARRARPLPLAADGRSSCSCSR